NVAHALTTVSGCDVTLIDLDMQFGAIPVYFDLFPKRGMLQALDNIEGLDEVAFGGYLVKHSSGVRVLGHAADDTLPTQPVTPQHVSQLLSLAARGAEHLVVDLPRRIDAVAAVVIERSQHVVLVVQQSVATIRDATRLMNCLRRELGVNKERIVVVVNRYDKDAPITAEDIPSTLHCGELSLVPNDFRTMAQCVDAGTP